MTPTTDTQPLAGATCSDAPVGAACNVADYIRNYVRQRQHAIRCQSGHIHRVAPIQWQAWLLVIEELDHVADVCISVSRRTIEQPNPKLRHGPETES